MVESDPNRVSRLLAAASRLRQVRRARQRFLELWSLEKSGLVTDVREIVIETLTDALNTDPLVATPRGR